MSLSRSLFTWWVGFTIAQSGFYLQLFCTFVYVETLFNWYCAKYYTSKYVSKVDKSCMMPREEIQVKIKSENVEDLKTCTISEKPRAGGDSDTKLSRILRKERLTLLWKWCKICENFCPPRAHHCKVNRPSTFRKFFVR